MTIVAAVAVGPTIGFPLVASVLLLILFWALGLRDTLRWHAVAVHATSNPLVDGDEA